MKPLAFVKDPDGYWIEIIEAKATANIAKELGKI
jgi:lactoylglutathione lyase